MLSREILTRALVLKQTRSFNRSDPDVTSNHHTTQKLGRQAFRFHKKVFVRSMLDFDSRLDARAFIDEWRGAALRRSLRQVWDHRHGLSTYQVWTGYRVVTPTQSVSCGAS
uniref:RxLR effector candidate protein n=1 Tax=Hyaloperonospora arabidopsidis (strain Emoy2) TaxID=559515 RepID=M4B952_HYAAE